MQMHNNSAFLHILLKWKLLFPVYIFLSLNIKNQPLLYTSQYFFKFNKSQLTLATRLKTCEITKSSFLNEVSRKQLCKNPTCPLSTLKQWAQ